MKVVIFLLTLLATTINAQGIRPRTPREPSYQINRPASVGNLFQITGSNTKFGEYAGVGFLSGNGKIFQRIIRFKNYSYKGDKVETVWEGNVENNVMTTSLKLSQYLVSVDNYAPFEADLKNPIPVKGVMENGAVSFAVKENGIYSETWTFMAEATKRLWKNERKLLNMTGSDSKTIKYTFKAAGVENVIEIYNKLDIVNQYKNHPIYKSKKHYYVSDPTDAIEIKANPNVLRISMKSINDLSLHEAISKRNAYGKSFAEKEKYFLAEMRKYNFNSLGFIEPAVVNNRQEKVRTAPIYDSLLWSSMYGWAEAIKYEKTGDEVAYRNFKKVIEGIILAEAIVGDGKNFARGVIESPANQSVGGWVQGTNQFANYKWLPIGNNDMCKSFFITLTLAKRILRDDEVALKNKIIGFTHKMMYLKVVRENDGNKMLAQGVYALWNNDKIKFKDFNKNAQSFTNKAARYFGIDSGMHYQGIADWSGIHLRALTTAAQILIADELMKVFPKKKSDLKDTRKIATKRLAEMNETYDRAHTYYLGIFTHYLVPEWRNKSKNIETAKLGKNLLMETPAPKNLGNAKVNLFTNPEWSVSYWPKLPWKGLTGFRKYESKEVIGGLIQGSFRYPLYEGIAWHSEYMWKENFFSDIVFGSNPSMVPMSQDYLLLYWMARSSGLISEYE